MTDGNGEGKLRKKCPLLKEQCIGADCALSVQLQRSGQKFSMCAFNGLVQIMAEINAKTQAAQERVILQKGLFKG